MADSASGINAAGARQPAGQIQPHRRSEAQLSGDSISCTDRQHGSARPIMTQGPNDTSVRTVSQLCVGITPCPPNSRSREPQHVLGTAFHADLRASWSPWAITVKRNGFSGKPELRCPVVKADGNLIHEGQEKAPFC